MRTWIVRYKEIGRNNIWQTSHTGALSKDEVIDFFGLNGDDVEWYEVIDDKD